MYTNLALEMGILYFFIKSVYFVLSHQSFLMYELNKLGSLRKFIYVCAHSKVGFQESQPFNKPTSMAEGD